MNSAITYNYKTISHALEKPRKVPEWIQRVAAVNAAARAGHESYGQYVARIHEIRIRESHKTVIPDGYHTAREWERIRSAGAITYEIESDPEGFTEAVKL